MNEDINRQLLVTIGAMEEAIRKLKLTILTNNKKHDTGNNDIIDLGEYNRGRG